MSNAQAVVTETVDLGFTLDFPQISPGILHLYPGFLSGIPSISPETGARCNSIKIRVHAPALGQSND
jgi:hypothetical protein